MITPFQNFFRKFRKCASGNATMLVAIGMPALIGGTGFAVDTAQWYMWQRELQFATDQAAIAAGWALTDSDSQQNYTTRARQEYNANLATTKDFATTPNISLANFAGGTNNSVIVSSSATHPLPFSSLILGRPTTVNAFAQAQFEEGTSFTSCIISLDDDEDGAITISGNSLLTAGCGMAALSTSDDSVTVNGNPEINAGWVISAGGIDDWFDTHTNDTILEYMDGLYDPYESLQPPSPPNSQVARTYSCPAHNAGANNTTADVSVTTVTTYEYFKGASKNNASPHTYAAEKEGGTANSGPNNEVVPEGTTVGTVSNTTVSWFNIAGNGSSKVWEKTTTSTTTTYANVQITNGASAASVVPGTYTDLNLRCDTVFTGGVYVIDGGELEIHSQYNVTGAGVMFVLKNGAGIRVNGGSSVNLTAMTVSELMAQGLSASDAADLAGMLIFEDRESEGSDRNLINGNATTVLNGTIYLPVSNIDFAGTASVTSQCLMIAAATIRLTGTTNMTTFCPEGVNTDTTVAETGATVKLVA